MVNQVHSAQAYMAIRTILDRMRHEGCGGRAGKAELVSGIEGGASAAARCDGSCCARGESNA